MDVFRSSSSSISKDQPVMQLSGALNGSTNTCAPGGRAVSAVSEAAAAVVGQQSTSSGINLPSCNYNYNHMPLRNPSHGAFMQQQQQTHQPYYNYYNYHHIPTLTPSPPPPPPLYPSPYNSYYLPPPPPSPLLLLRQKIAKQIDYYFCDDNLAKDEYLRMNMDEEGWVPIALVAGFRRVSQLSKDTEFVLDSLMQFSCNVEVKGDKIRRRGNWKKWLLNPRRQQES